MMHSLSRFAADLDRWLTKEDIEEEPVLTDEQRGMLERMQGNPFVSQGAKKAIAKALEVIDYYEETV
jgi:hypothetical protein